jgi:hypothetical protein
MTKSTTRPTLALLVQAETNYGTHRITAQVVVPKDDGGKLELHAPEFRRYGDAVEKAAGRYNGFTLSAYVGDSYSKGDKPGEIWGAGYFYEPHRVESAEHALAIAGVLRTLDRGLDKIRDAEGYINHDDFHTLILRVARILKIKTIYVRNTRKARDVSGERFRKVDGSGLQGWVEHTAALARDGQYAEATS